MQRRVLHLLERLARQEAGELRRELAAVEIRRRQLDEAVERERGARTGEVTAALAMHGGAMLAGAYWVGSRRREATWLAEGEMLRVQAEQLLEQVVEAFATESRYKEHGAAIGEADALRLERNELREIEDLGRSRSASSGRSS